MAENDLHQKGMKDDDNKPRLDLVLGGFANALFEVGKVGTFGAKKYTDNGWKDVNNAIERYSNAMLRHYFKHKTGEYRDEESNLFHISHMAWNALALLELYIQYTNNRYSTIGDIVEQYSDHSDFRPIKKEQLE